MDSAAILVGDAYPGTNIRVSASITIGIDHPGTIIQDNASITIDINHLGTIIQVSASITIGIDHPGTIIQVSRVTITYLTIPHLCYNSIYIYRYNYFMKECYHTKGATIYMSENRFDDIQRTRMENPERRKLLPQDHILSLLNIDKSDVILDIGAGVGYFTFPLAQRTNNTVYALDIEQHMLDDIQKHANEHTIQNLTLLQEPIEQIPLEAHTIDCALASMVLHEVETLRPALTKIYNIIKPGGRFVVVDWIPEPNDPRANRIDSGFMQRTAERVGFALDVITTPSEKVYAIAFDKPGKK